MNRLFSQPAVPCRPESVEAMRRRYPLAVEPIFDVESVALGVATRPGELPANTFDFNDGIRLIVSRKRAPDGEVLLIMSASAREGSFVTGVESRRLRPGSLEQMEAVVVPIVRHWRDISGDEKSIVLCLGCTDGGVLHFRVIEEGEVRA